MFARHTRLVRVLQWRRQGVGDGEILARLTSRGAITRDVARDALAVDPLDELLRDASFDEKLDPQTVAEEGAAFEEERDPEWDVATRTWIGRIASALEALGQTGVASESVVRQVVESLQRAQHALPFDWAADFATNPYRVVVKAAGAALGRLRAWETEGVGDVRGKGKYSPWYPAILAMVEAAPESVPETLILALTEQGDADLLRRIPVDRWPESAVLAALGLDLFDHIGPRVSLTPSDVPRLEVLIRESEAAVRNLARLEARASVAAGVLEARLRELAEASQPLAPRLDARMVEVARALEAVGGVRPEDLVADPSPAVRRVAVRLLAPGASHLGRVLGAMDDEDASVRVSAARVLAARRDAATEPPLREALADAHPRVRLVALEALVERRVDDLATLLGGAARSDPDPSVRWSAKRVLAERGETSEPPGGGSARTSDARAREDERRAPPAAVFRVETERCRIDVQREPDGILSLRFRGTMDEEDPLFRTLQSLEDRRLDRVLVDLSAVEFGAALFEGTLVQVYQRVTRTGGRLVFVAPPRPFLRQMELSGLQKVFVVLPDEATARGRLAGT